MEVNRLGFCILCLHVLIRFATRLDVCQAFFLMLLPLLFHLKTTGATVSAALTENESTPFEQPDSGSDFD